jgi:plasmid replication initiation protein
MTSLHGLKLVRIQIGQHTRGSPKKERNVWINYIGMLSPDKISVMRTKHFK